LSKFPKRKTILLEKNSAHGMGHGGVSTLWRVTLPGGAKEKCHSWISVVSAHSHWMPRGCVYYPPLLSQLEVLLLRSRMGAGVSTGWAQLSFINKSKTSSEQFPSILEIHKPTSTAKYSTCSCYSGK